MKASFIAGLLFAATSLILPAAAFAAQRNFNNDAVEEVCAIQHQFCIANCSVTIDGGTYPALNENCKANCDYAYEQCRKSADRKAVRQSFKNKTSTLLR